MNAIVPIRYWRLDAHDRVTIDDIHFVPDTQSEFGHVLRRVDNPDLCESFTHDQFENLRSDGRLMIVRGHFMAARSRLRTEQSFGRVTDLDPDKRIKVLWEKSICDEFLRMEEQGLASRSDASMSLAIATIVSKLLTIEFANGRCGSADVTVKRPPSPRSLRRWLNRYEAMGFHPMALADRYARCGDRMTVRFNTEERALMNRFAAAYADNRQPTKANLLKQLHAEIDAENKIRAEDGRRPLDKPSRKAFERLINRMDPFHVYAGRHSPEEARRKFYIVRGGLDVSRPLERIEVDESSINVQAILMDAGVWAELPEKQRAEVKRGRYFISSVIDTATRCCLAALVVENPSSATAVATLEMAVNDKSAYAAAADCETPWDMMGKFESVAQDSARWFDSHEFCAAVVDLGGEFVFPQTATPNMRGRKERFFGTVNQGLFSMFDGQSFANVVAKGTYKSEERATLDVAELSRLITRWIVDVYHNTPHSKLNGETPRNAWLRLVPKTGVIPPPTPDENRHVFGVTVERTITNEGIRLVGLNYQHPDLQKLRGRVGSNPVSVRFNPADIGFISVRREDDWLTVDCQREELFGVSLSHWTAAEALLRRTNAEMSKLAEPVVLKAIRDIKAEVDAARKRAGISSPTLTYAEFEKLNRERFSVFGMDRGPENGPPILALPPPKQIEVEGTVEDVIPGDDMDATDAAEDVDCWSDDDDDEFFTED